MYVSLHTFFKTLLQCLEIHGLQAADQMKFPVENFSELIDKIAFLLYS